MRIWFLVLLLAVTPSLTTGAGAAPIERRVALVVGNSNYANVPALPNPRNDASDIIGRLQKLGFDVVPGLDLDRTGLLNALAKFGRAAETADVALFFYAGHGLQVNGQNYLVPTDAKVEYEAELDLALVPMPLVMQQLSRGSRVNIVLLDACRDNPFSKDLSRTLGTRSASALGRGLSRIQSASGTFIAFATQPDNVAQDGDGRNSPFTRALLDNIEKPDLTLSDLMIEVRNSVMHDTNGKQVPWDSSSLTGRFSFRIEGTVTIGPQGGVAIAPQQAPTPPPGVDQRTLEYSVWNAIQNTNDTTIIDKFLKDFPGGLFAGAAREKLSRLNEPKTVVEPPPVQLTPAPAPKVSALPQGQSYSYVTGLNPRGDNWLALKAGPSLGATRLDKMGPNTLLTVIGRQGSWLHVRLRDGREGWAAEQYVACCRIVN